MERFYLDLTLCPLCTRKFNEIGKANKLPCRKDGIQWWKGYLPELAKEFRIGLRLLYILLNFGANLLP